MNIMEEMEGVVIYILKPGKRKEYSNFSNKWEVLTNKNKHHKKVGRYEKGILRDKF